MENYSSLKSSIENIKFFLLSTVLVFTLSLLSAYTNAQEVKIHYPDTEKPENIPIVFAKELVSSGEHEFSCCFSPDGKEFYFTRAVGIYKKKNIMVIKFDGENWSQPENALSDFDGETYEPHITSDGKKLYFMGMVLKEKDGEQTMFMDLYYAEKEDGQWSKITHLGEPFNPLKSMYISSTKDDILFTTNRSGEGPDVVYVKIENGEYSNYLDPGPTINTKQPELYPFVASDGSYLLFNRITDKGKHLFVCFQQNDGSWSKAIKVPLGIESGCPMVSPDGKFLFFNSGKKFLNDIYWVSSDVFLLLNPD